MSLDHALEAALDLAGRNLGSKTLEITLVGGPPKLACKGLVPQQSQESIGHCRGIVRLNDQTRTAILDVVRYYSGRGKDSRLSPRHPFDDCVGQGVKGRDVDMNGHHAPDLGRIGRI